MIQSHFRPTVVGLRGFTLIELLVVISIIGLLVALLLPALSAAHDSSATVQCMANQKQTLLALRTYATDTGTFPVLDDVSPTFEYDYMTVLVNGGYLVSDVGSQCTAKDFTWGYGSRIPTWDPSKTTSEFVPVAKRFGSYYWYYARAAGSNWFGHTGGVNDWVTYGNWGVPLIYYFTYGVNVNTVALWNQWIPDADFPKLRPILCCPSPLLNPATQPPNFGASIVPGGWAYTANHGYYSSVNYGQNDGSVVNYRYSGTYAFTVMPASVIKDWNTLWAK